MNRIQVRLDTQKDINEFVALASTIEEPIYLEDGTHYRADAKSLLGVMYGMMEFKELWVLSESDKLDTTFNKFIL